MGKRVAGGGDCSAQGSGYLRGIYQEGQGPTPAASVELGDRQLRGGAADHVDEPAPPRPTTKAAETPARMQAVPGVESRLKVYMAA